MPQPLDSRYLTDEWVDSKSVDGVSEVTLFTPIIPGFTPGEARTYEERRRSVLASVQRCAVDGTPTPIGLMPTIHYARWMVLRPGQYLQYCGYPAHPVMRTLCERPRREAFGDPSPQAARHQPGASPPKHSRSHRPAAAATPSTKRDRKPAKTASILMTGSPTGIVLGFILLRISMAT